MVTVQLTKWLEDEFVDEQVKAIRQLTEYVSRLTRVGSGLGEHIFDKELRGLCCDTSSTKN